MSSEKLNIQQLFEKFSDLKVIVLGDVMIDAYWEGLVNRISPEAPVPIINLSKHETRLGGAANVALNLVALGAMPIVCSCIGEDENATVLIDLLKKNAISDEGIVKSKKRTTTVKTRVIGNNQHLLRIDSEQIQAISNSEETLLLKRLEELMIKGVDVLIFEDYNKGVITKGVIKKAIELSKKYNVITTVDPKKDNFLAYQGVTLFKPNLKELKQGLNVQFSYSKNPEKLTTAVNLLERKLQNEISFVTLSQHGVYIQQHGSYRHFPAHVRHVADVSGAGDTVISVASLCLALDMPISWIASLANIAGGLVCEERGVVSINKHRLLQEALRLNIEELY